MKESKIECVICGSTNFTCMEKESDPIFFNFNIPILALSTVFKRRKKIAKCNNCGCELQIKTKKIIFK